MNSTFAAAQRAYDNRQPPEDYEPPEIDIIDRALTTLNAARSAYNRAAPEWNTARGHVADALADLGEIYLGD